MRKGVPAVLKPKAACPCPDTVTDGIKNWRAVATVAAESKIVPDWFTVGVPEPGGTINSYQRTAFRRWAPLDAAPVESTAMLCAVHNLPFRMCAAKRRSSSALRLPFVPPVSPR